LSKRRKSRKEAESFVPAEDSIHSADRSSLPRRHRIIGWWSLLLFLTMGLALEAFHAWKLDWYVSVANETRRWMWTLAHAHGTLLALVNLVFVAAVDRRAGGPPRSLSMASACLIAATCLLPLGFLLGGVVIYGGDPGRGILLVPVGAVLLMVAVLITALDASRR